MNGHNRSRPQAIRSTGYQHHMLFFNDWGGRLTIPRQDECDPDARFARDPDEGRDLAHLKYLEARERARSDYFAGLAAKYRRASSHPWLPVEVDPPPPE